MRKRSLFTSSVLWVWLVSYLVVLILPLLVNFFMFRVSWNIVDHNTASRNETTLRQAETAVSRIFSDIYSDARKIINDQAAVSMTFAETPLTVTKRERVGQFQQELRKQVAYSDYIREIHVYFRYPAMVASTEGFFGKEYLLDDLSARLRLEKDVLSGWIDNCGFFSVRMVNADPESGLADKLLLMAGNTAARPPDRGVYFCAGYKGNPIPS